MGVATTNKALSSLEHGAGLDVCKLPELARALDCTLTYLVGLTDDPERWEPDIEHWPGRRPHPRPAPRAAQPAVTATGRAPPDAARRSSVPRRTRRGAGPRGPRRHMRRISR